MHHLDPHTLTRRQKNSIHYVLICLIAVALTIEGWTYADAAFWLACIVAVELA